MKNFLVAVDFSAITARVIEDTEGLARALGGKITLLHVVPTPTSATAEFPVPVEDIQGAIVVLNKDARDKLAEYAGKVGRDGLSCAAEVLVGDPVDLILEQARKSKADYIVMGSHGHGKLYDFLVGSTASGVIKRAKCGVIILPIEKKHG